MRRSGRSRARAETVSVTEFVALARALGFALDRPNPQAIDSQLRYPLLRGPRAEIEDVREILPGEIAHMGRVGRQAGSWLPWDHALSPPRRSGESGFLAIDPATRDIVQTVYVRKVEKVGSEVYNVEFDKFENMKDTGK